MEIISFTARTHIEMSRDLTDILVNNRLKTADVNILNELYRFTGATCFENLVYRLSEGIYSEEVKSFKSDLLDRLSNAVHGTDKDLYTDGELDSFALDFILRNYQSGDQPTDDFIVDMFLDFWWESEKPCRRCSICGDLMRDGYCENGGDAYYCSDKCLHKVHTDEEWNRLCEEDDQTYYTDWY
ncbi:MAG: hypothetical protein MJZ11_10695 [Lachnospiraceae bacterium]|nr:hypothetical protein [Lachnospiraceae bacterium]